MKKLKLSDLKIRSFVTKVSNQTAIRGGEEGDGSVFGEDAQSFPPTLDPGQIGCTGNGSLTPQEEDVTVKGCCPGW